MYLKDQGQGLDNSFDAPILKAQTQMQQPGHAGALEQQPPSPSIKIPSQVPSQSDLSEGAQKSRPHNAKAKKKEVFVPQQDLLREHRINYRKHYDRHQVEYRSRAWDLESLAEQMKATKIKCVKYNYSLDAGVQNFLQFDGLLHLSEDGKKLVLTLKKYSETPIHVLQPDPHTVKKMRTTHQNKVRRNTALLKREIKNKAAAGADEAAEQRRIFEEAEPDRHSYFSDDGGELVRQYDEKDEDEPLPAFNEEEEIERIKDRYTFTESSTTCAISDIQGIIFGGFSSRFWIYRKHLCCLDYDILKKDTKRKAFRGGKTELPFYAWQCITLELAERQVDLVIKDQKSMDLFIKFLIFSINTMDCRKDSAENYVKGATMFEVQRREKLLRKAARERGRWTRADLELTQDQKDEIEYQWRKKIYQ